ncbi:hypothetical protein CH063_00602 [Colletotrichum higginsianum]|uniref:Uncharacterized protein n=1 Tax=Colletotrichum higginsianum (strain IMI 349063) TaxID=759273 RepID=H1W1E8_COLHI|nr:uncharacterized protein CH63R_10788 [Colletotrichum higginsianum IMI 349063]OBR06668.1 hypothetical protein CH63R_10788 [Colletotrichum higginsianum IMI 349063]CCF46311.1 hypothetical protein CH063_00602 [Colletotrichum higginsianum]
MNRIALRQTRLFAASVPRARAMSSQNPIHDAADAVGQEKDTNPAKPSVISSEGAVGKQFNPDGNVGQIGEAVGGPFSKDGAIGSQFDASKGGIAGTVEKAVDGPRNPAKK